MTWGKGNLVLTLTNRDFKPPEDGFFHVVPLGEFENAESDVLQICDAEAMKAMKNAFDQDAKDPNFPGVLVDYDHASHDRDKSTEAAGWITELENRSAGLFARIRWSDVGQAAVNGGRFRLVSPVFYGEDLQDLGERKVRPLKLGRLAVTNDPNMSGLVPLSNRTSSNSNPTLMNYKEKLCNVLGLPVTATDEEIDAALTGMANKNQAAATAAQTATTAKAEAANRKAENEQLVNRLRTVETERDSLLSAQIERDLDENKELIEDREGFKALLVANRKEALGMLKLLKKPAPTADPKKPLHNRATAGQPAPIGTDQPTEADKKEKAAIRNRAVVLRRDSKGRRTFQDCWAQAESEVAARA